ncbi:uncharacterized protein NECHADRAFT_75599 [Fusarium vanettenii 77-13-4]|uniref:Uncharacterized protein n=1 Tax=Fusarium vanettenii (strain ATCC MYA-4622 / CBS 123669 / FGSC 9596 / NRRL 45880 / 77-13-4) TaxID=660122 RepID=C7YJ93_FUSV7|nr:uncharacterized protein NECHADRAFT_75599 [Fusarium vanettenii 77-13-4]EEU48231.1 hypothetical protein NECHADRAFT_75599 [Fusarium vanettenii 77-13-4]
MGKDFLKRVSDLESRLTSIREDSDTCSSSAQNNHFDAQRNLARATGRAMSALKALIQHPGSSHSSSLADFLLEDMKSAWLSVYSCGEACSSCAREHRDSLLSHGDDLKKWSKEAKLVEAELHLSLRTVQNEVASETTSLQRYHEELEVAKNAVDEADRDNMEVKRKYFEVHEWTSSFPTTWDFEQKLQIAMQARERNLKRAEANLEKSRMRVNKAETKLDGHKSRVETLSTLAQKVARIQAKGHALSHRYKAIAEDATVVSSAMNSLKVSYREAVGLANMVSISMHKVESAKYILGIIDAALDDSTLVNELAELIHYMEYRYDSSCIVHTIVSPDHPYGILSGVQKKLRSKQLQFVPPRGFDMYSLRDMNTKSLAAMHVDMMRSILFTLDRDEHRLVRVSPCRIGRGELTDMLRHNIRMTWGDTLEGDY